MCLTLGADVRIAAESAYFRAAGINNGLNAAELGLSYILPRAVGATRAFEIMLTGRDIGAEEASNIGLISRSVKNDELLDECIAMAQKMVGFSQIGLEMTKEMMWAGLEAGSRKSHMHHEAQAQLLVRMTTENFEEAIRARKQKRPPVFKD